MIALIQLRTLYALLDNNLLIFVELELIARISSFANTPIILIMTYEAKCFDVFAKENST